MAPQGMYTLIKIIYVDICMWVISVSLPTKYIYAFVCSGSVTKVVWCMYIYKGIQM